MLTEHFAVRDKRFTKPAVGSVHVERLWTGCRWPKVPPGSVPGAISSGRTSYPNDVVVKSDGSIWFTDPTYGIDSD
jgi:hypothetical protein